MAKAERAKGLRGELEVRGLWERHGFTVRGLEATGDHLVVGAARLIHCETKRQETARPWAWWEQAQAETPPGAATFVPFRRSRSPWLVIADLEQLAAMLARAEG